MEIYSMHNNSMYVDGTTKSIQSTKQSVNNPSKILPASDEEMRHASSSINDNKSSNE
jgi:hypothetical protein